MGFRYYNKQQQVWDDEWQGEWGPNLNNMLCVIWAQVRCISCFFLYPTNFFFHFRYYKSTKTESGYDEWWVEMGRTNDRREQGPNDTWHVIWAQVCFFFPLFYI